MVPRVEHLNRSGSAADLSTSCRQIRVEGLSHGNGVYYIRDSNMIAYPVNCDMTLGGGGWTLVASIHENNIRATGRCQSGDRWSSEHGNEQNAKVGADNWSNYNTFGHVASATSDDYKNQAYFDLQVRDVMIWQVPNDTPLEEYDSSSYLQYRTTDGFLKDYGGNLYHFYKTYFPIRAINQEKSAYALCPFGKPHGSNGDIEHGCIGSTADIIWTQNIVEILQL
ncbi:unnamed protein product [Clavelina lepadiformis]|uniref:Fibrinogen C-terminal domain-containing protein n=1 Tax=Clavelina lepadiformis TaxID=159417 RepID=A0ABP0EZ98_CLALP